MFVNLGIKSEVELNDARNGVQDRLINIELTST